MRDKQPSVGVVGGGYWGKNLVRVFNELGVLGAICDSDSVKQHEYAQSYPGVEILADYEKLLGRKNIQGIAIAVPAAEHYKMTKLALQAGKDVLVEKPLALQVNQGQELVNLAREKDLVLMVGHILEYHPAVTSLAQLIKKGELGQIRYIYSNRLNLGKVRREENVLWSFAPHDISVIIRLLGEKPVALSSFGREYLNKGVADVTVTNMVFPDGVGAHIFVSWLNPFKEQKLAVVGSEKMAVFDDLAEDKLVLYRHRVDVNDAATVVEKAGGEKVAVPAAEPLKLECKHFLECMEERKEALTGPKNALEVLQVLAAAQQSMEMTGKMVYLD